MPTVTRKYCPYCPWSAVCLGYGWDVNMTVRRDVSWGKNIREVTCEPTERVFCGNKMDWSTAAGRITFTYHEETLKHE